MSSDRPASVRLDRWLWAARFFKTRAQAKTAIDGGKIQVDGAKPKVAKEIRVGASIRVRKGPYEQTVLVTSLAEKRGSASDAALLYQETTDSVEQRETLRAELQMQRAGLRLPQKKPNKQERRARSELKRDTQAANEQDRSNASD